MEVYSGFMEQTARDYDMPVWKVKEIYEKSSTTAFYENLEIYIKERANS